MTSAEERRPGDVGADTASRRGCVASSGFVRRRDGGVVGHGTRSCVSAGCQYAVVQHQIDPGARRQCGQLFQELDRGEQEVRCPVVPFVMLSSA